MSSQRRGTVRFVHHCIFSIQNGTGHMTLQESLQARRPRAINTETKGKGEGNLDFTDVKIQREHHLQTKERLRPPGLGERVSCRPPRAMESVKLKKSLRSTFVSLSFFSCQMGVTADHVE
ncbi:hypothetical protein PRBEI_2001603000 [Prionailurus iriomotensis]